MKELKDLLEETFRAGFNAAQELVAEKHRIADQVKEHAWADHLARPAVQNLIAVIAFRPKHIKCSMHGEQSPVAACKPCLDAMQAMIHKTQLVQAIDREAAVAGMPPPPLGSVPIIQPGSIAKAAAPPPAPEAPV